MNSDRLVKWVFFGLTALFILFIVYASWTPSDSVFDAGQKLRRGIEHPRDLFRAHNLRDIATNVLLYLPLGVFLSLAVCRPKARFVSPWIIVGTAVSLTMEVGQSFIGRTPDIVDIVTNTTGYVIGFWLVVAGVKLYGLDPVVFLGFEKEGVQDTKIQSIAAFRFIYICIYVLIALLPFDISVRLSEIYAQLFPDDTGKIKIILDPGYTVSNWQDNGLKLTLELAGLLPIGALTAFLSGVRGRLSVFSAVFSCVSVVVVCEIAQVFVLSRTTDIVMIPIAIVAGIAGWALAKVWLNVQAPGALGGADAVGGEPGGANWRPLAVALIGYALVIAFFAWSPFNFETDPKTVVLKILHDSNAVPFREHFAVRSLASAVDIVKETGLFVPFGLLLALLMIEIRPGMPRSSVLVWAGVFSAGFATVTELSQAVCIGRYVDVTDILLGGFGGLCGAVLLQLFRTGGATRPAPGGYRR
ncbi:MAG: VanZ family protein [Candidatus Latescibacterota bacterium]|jgi:glycopeptide antibiotics resistance protein